MPTFLAKAGKFLGNAVKNKAKDKVKDKVKDAATSEDGRSAISKSVLILFIISPAAMFIFIILILLLAISSNLDTTFGAVGGFKDSSSSSSSTVVGTSVVNCAHEQLGKPYVWGATGPDSFDCSGLVQYCYNEAGVTTTRTDSTIRNNANTSEDWEVSSLSGSYKAYPGDILWKSGHVGIVNEVDDNGAIISYIHAPSTGDVVKITTFNQSGFTEIFHYIE